MKTFGASTINFFLNLKPDFHLPDTLQFLLPYQNKMAKEATEKFYGKYYNDRNKRTFIIGINPGRFGAGTTGISFTDPIMLEDECKIKNSFLKKSELSSTFIYNVIKEYGGVESFYSKFFLTSVCPIGFIKNGKNINYYDDKILLQTSRNFIVKSIKTQIEFGAGNKAAICLGEGKNYQYLKKLNEEMKFFKEIIPIAHPRYIMQYKRKKVEEYFTKYLKLLTEVIEKNN